MMSRRESEHMYMHEQIKCSLLDDLGVTVNACDISALQRSLDSSHVLDKSGYQVHN